MKVVLCQKRGRNHRSLAGAAISTMAILAIVVLPASLSVKGQTITYVQGAYSSPQSSPTSVSVTFPSAQAVGDLNVVVVGWNDSKAAVSSVSDKSGNTYALAAGPTVQSS